MFKRSSIFRIACFFMASTPIFIYAEKTNNIGTLGRINLDNQSNQSITANSVYASNDTYGMRASAVVMAVRANPDKPFEYPINGFSWTKALSHYNNRDSVGLYADNTSPPFKSWEIINRAQYTPTSFTSQQVDTTKIKPGMLIDTDHNPKWSAYVVSVNNNKVITNGWVNSHTKRLGTPENGIGLKINPTSKIWASNFNLFFSQNGRANSGVIQENGLINNSLDNPAEINGIDNVILPSSKYGGTAAFLARSATSGQKQQWALGFMSQGAQTANFYSGDSAKTNSTETGFLENSHAKVGLAFTGKNQNSSIEWYSSGKMTAKISNDGKIEKISYKTKLITSDSQLSDTIVRYIINGSKDITLKLPKEDDLPDGLTLEVDNFSKYKVSITAESPLNISPTIGKRINIFYHNGQWYLI